MLNYRACHKVTDHHFCDAVPEATMSLGAVCWRSTTDSPLCIYAQTIAEQSVQGFWYCESKRAGTCSRDKSTRNEAEDFVS